MPGVHVCMFLHHAKKIIKPPIWAVRDSGVCIGCLCRVIVIKRVDVSVESL